MNVTSSVLCRSNLFPIILNKLPTRNFAVKKTEPAIASLGKASKKKIGKFGPAVEKKLLPVETDANRLVNYVCGTNLLKEGGEDVKIKPDSEYPEWLWTLRTGKPPTLQELDPNSMEYWQKVRKIGRRRTNHMKSLNRF